jgi:hypothetical protein
VLEAYAKAVHDHTLRPCPQAQEHAAGREGEQERLEARRRGRQGGKVSGHWDTKSQAGSLHLCLSVTATPTVTATANSTAHKWQAAGPKPGYQVLLLPGGVSGGGGGGGGAWEPA